MYNRENFTYNNQENFKSKLNKEYINLTKIFIKQANCCYFFKNNEKE